MRNSNSKQISRLGEIKRVFNPQAADEKISLMSAVNFSEVLTKYLLPDFHSTLLFIIAYPDNQGVHSKAIQTLELLNDYLLKYAPAEDDFLINSGLPGTVVNWRPGWVAGEWMCDHFPKDVSIDWTDMESVVKLEEYLPFLAEPIEKEGTAMSDFTTSSWLENAFKTNQDEQESYLLKILTQHFKSLHISPDLKDKWFEDLMLSVSWTLQNPDFSKSYRRVESSVAYYPAGLKREINCIEEIKKPVKIKLLGKAEVDGIDDVLKAALFYRKRETDPITFLNPSEIYHVPLGNGMEMFLTGIEPTRRLIPDSYIGYTLLKNGLPMAYGGGWSFLDRCEIGINIFDEYRGGESNLVFCSIMRAYYHLFRCSKFIVQPYQFGADNREGLLSGAYWFYYKLGYRSVNADINALANYEFEKIKADRLYKSSIKVLAKLATCAVELVLPGYKQTQDRILQGKLSLFVTSWIGQKFSGNRILAKKWATKWLAEMLGIRDYKSWPQHEKESFSQLALWFAPHTEIKGWKSDEKRQLTQCLRTKGSARERDFSLELRSHSRATKWLEAICTLEK